MIACAWDHGVRWKTELVSTTAGFLALDVDFVIQKVLRAVTDVNETELIEGYIRAATQICKRCTDESVNPERLNLILDRFPARQIELQSPPVRSIVSIEYYDSENVLQAYGGSPPSWIFVTGGRHGKPTVQPGVGQTWPATAVRPDAVTVTYDVGYVKRDQIPPLYSTGIALVVGELYKNPDLSNADGQTENLLGLSHFFPRRW